MIKTLPAMWETRVWSMGWEDPLEKAMATHSSTLAWKIPWTEEPGRLQPMGSRRVGHDWATSRSRSRSYVECKKKRYKWTYFKKKQRLSDLENKLMVSGARDHSGVWDRHVHTAIFKIYNQQGSTAEHREPCSVLCGSLYGRGVWGGWIHIYVWLSPFAVHLKWSQYC